MLYNIFTFLCVLLCTFASYMAGIYVHIPFCKSRCIYCGFFSTTSLEKRNTYVDAVCRELQERCEYIGNEVETIYFGGGTPTQMPLPELKKILGSIYNIYNVRANAEITVECNPDDLSEEMLRELKNMGVTRLSMGVQTFSDARLRFLNRRHSAAQAERAVKMAQEVGFDNISIDLMFGFPGQTLEEWKEDVEHAILLNVQHISAYSLMYEEGTRLGMMLDRGEVEEVSDDVSLSMYEFLIDALTSNGFLHYEISNFAKPGKESRHNSSYWHGVPYLGVGAGAHSYDGRSRHYNPDSLTDYLNSAPLEEEILTDEMRYNEYVFTGLRTSAGIDVEELKNQFGTEMYDYCMTNAQKHLDAGLLQKEERIMKLSRRGLFVSNDIMSDLMCVSE